MTYEINLQDYLRIMRKRKWIILLCFSVIFIGGIMWVRLLPQTYEASCIIKVTTQRTIGELFTSIFNEATKSLVSEAMTISSQSCVEEAATELQLITPQHSRTDIDNIVSNLKNYIQTEVIKGTNQIKITVTHPDRFLVAPLANKLAEAYINQDLVQKSKESHQLRIHLGEQLAEVDKKLTESENALKEFKNKEDVIGSAIPLQNKLAELEQTLLTYSQQYTEAGKPYAITNLKNEIEEIKEKLKKLPEKEIELSRINRELVINSKLYTTLKENMQVAKMKEAEKASDATLIDMAVESTSPIAPYKTNIYITSFILGLIIALSVGFIAEHLDTSIATIEDIENITKLLVLGIIPYFKPKNQSLTNWHWLTRSLRLKHNPVKASQWLLFYYPPTSPVVESYGILRNQILSNFVKEKETSRLGIGARMGGPVVSTPPSTTSPSPIPIQKPDVSTFRSLSALFTNQRPFRPPSPPSQLVPPTATRDKDKKIVEKKLKTNITISITSAMRNEGKSLTSTNLAISMAQLGYSTLLIDVDLRKPSLHKLFDTLNENGVGEFINGKATFQACVRTGVGLGGHLEHWRKIPYLDNLSMIPAGKHERYPSELIRSPKIKEILEEAKRKYEIIIVDCPPILGMGDMLVMGTYVDILLLLYRSGCASRKVFIRGKQQLENAGINFKGIIINGIKPQLEPAYSHYYYYNYGEKPPDELPPPSLETDKVIEVEVITDQSVQKK
ncbi:MAG: polysaccharide biosynthesis tyrosine autokinase [Planctomycetota bacterium]